MRRALARADAGKTLNTAEGAVLIGARGEDLDRLMGIASRVRDQAFGDRITYSRKVFIPLTHLCRDTCGYCTFAWPPKGDIPAFMSIDEVVEVARQGQAAGCKEALFTLGDKPEERYPAARQWLDERGYDSTLAYLRAAAIAVIEQTGLIPHLNPGVMTWTELATLKPVSGSMGIMLESASLRLHEKGMPHHNCPDKVPAVRLQVLEDAGKHAIPFTSGILIGIGETATERVEALLALAATAKRYGHLQEVIVQNFRAKPDTAMRRAPEPSLDDLLATIAVARLLLPTKVHLQAPPNLSPADEARIAAAGIDDWGGVSPVTPDHVNPEAPWPHLDDLTDRTAQAGKVLTERLCVYPEFVRKPDPWLAGQMRVPVQDLATPEGLARTGHQPSPQTWQAPDMLAAGADDRWTAAEAGDGVTGWSRGQGTLRPDAGDVYGDTGLIAAETLSAARPPRDSARSWSSSARAEGLRDRASSLAEIQPILHRATAGTPPTQDEAEVLFAAEGEALDAVVRAADQVRRDRVGDTVTYVVNRNINFTNVCYVGCRFCAFAQRRDDPDAYTLSLDEVADRAEEAWAFGATEVCMQGGIHPDLPTDHYAQIIRAVKDRVPEMHVHAFSPMEVVTGATRSGVSIPVFVKELADAGLDTIPGTAAEILDDEVRWVLTKGKLPTSAWIEVMQAAHAQGIRSTATMMFGHVDEPRHWAAHLWLLRRLQLESHGAGHRGFTEFVPLPFVHEQSPIYLAGVARPGPSWTDTVKVHAIARLVLQGAIDNVQLSWVKLGTERAVELLNAGVNDLGGTLMEETISRMAGADHGVRKDPEELRAIAAAAGRPAAERTTDYSRIEPSGIRYQLVSPT